MGLFPGIGPVFKPSTHIFHKHTVGALVGDSRSLQELIFNNCRFQAHQFKQLYVHIIDCDVEKEEFEKIIQSPDN